MHRRLRQLLAVLFALAIVLYLALAFVRCGHPFELEWEEGGMLQHVERVLAGQSIYAEPSLEYMAFPYPPLFVWLGALSTKVFGPGFLALRLVSIVGSIACLALIYRSASRRAGSAYAGWFAAGLYALAFRFSGAWFDVARVDSLFLALTLLAIEILDTRRGARAAALGGFVFFLAFLAKQSALVPAGCVFLVLAWRERRAALAFTLALGVPLVVSTCWLQSASEGWYRWYVFDLLSGAPWSGEMVGRFWLETLLHLAPALVLAWFARARATAVGVPILAAACVGLWLISWVSRAHVGGYDNTLMPACAVGALLFGPALVRALDRGGRMTLVAALLALVQFALLAYDARAQVPTATDRAAGEMLVAKLRATAGAVWMPDHGYLAERAGKTPSAHGMAVIDLLQGKDRATAQRFVDQLTRALSEKRYAAVVLDQRWDELLPQLAQQYRASEWRYADSETFVPVTGDHRRPLYWYEAR